MGHMSPRLKARRGRFGSGGFAPNVTITSPASGFAASTGTPFAATATAIDPESGDISANLVWSSNLDGGSPAVVGTGGSVNITLLTVGTHIITASAADAGSPPNVGTDTITVVVS